MEYFQAAHAEKLSTLKASVLIRNQHGFNTEMEKCRKYHELQTEGQIKEPTTATRQ